MGKRRGSGEGSVFRRNDGSWIAQLDLGYIDGKRCRPLKRCRTKREAHAALSELRAQHEPGVKPISERFTVGQYLDEWFRECVKNRLKPSTVQDYEQQIRLYLKPHLGRIPLTKLVPMDVQRMVNALHDDGLVRAPQYAYSVLRSALKQAELWRMTRTNAARLVRVPKAPKETMRPLCPEETKVFMEAVKGDRLEALYTVAVSLGLRQGEAFALRRTDIDFAQNTLSVRHTLQRSGDSWSLVPPKTDRSRRTITMPAVCRSALIAHIARQEEEKAAAGREWQEHGLVFSTRIGTPLDSPNVLKRFHRILKRAGLPEIRFHDLRHTCATLLLAQGVHPRLVMDILGHSSITVTMNIYSHVIPAMREEVAAKMDEILNPLAVSLAVNTDTLRPN
jgi:integrase